jgi:LacI family transcriptional regulator, galactose operon repressor
MVDLAPHSAYWRGVITGVARFCRERQNFAFRMLALDWELLGTLEPVDGVIAAIPWTEPAHTPTRYGKPVVNVSSMALPVEFPTVSVDNMAIGRMAADHLMHQGYRTFACHMESRVYYSRQRLAGFRKRLNETGRDCEVFDTSPTAGHGSDAMALRDATCRWLKSMHHPAGLYTHGDLRAAALLEICRDLGLSVPEQIGILGTDNDELLCGSTSPTLSSVDLAPNAVGYHAAELLGELMSGAAIPAGMKMVPPRGVIGRESTHPTFTDDEMLAQAVAMIRDRAGDPIDVSDILQAVPMSRRSLERHFRARLGRSPSQEIRRVQMDRAKFLLAETDQTLRAIAGSCGYGEFRNFATAFRREVGLSPSQFRRDFRTR